MIYMKEILGVFVTCVLIASCQTQGLSSQSGGLEWTYKTGEEDWGPTVYVSSSDNSGQSVTILSDASSFRPTMLLSPYRPEYGTSFPVRVLVDSQQIAVLEGGFSDYFGELEVSGMKKGVLERMKSGKVLSLKIDGHPSYEFGLSGSSSAISSFLGGF